MSLPIANPKSPEIQRLISKMRRPPHPVLIVEDREENQMLLAGICQSVQVPYKLADNGSVALDLLGQNAFSIYIVDLMMPVMDGKTFITRLKEKKPDAVILVQTAIDTTDEIIEIMKLGVYDYLVKPLNVELITASLIKALEYRYLIDIENALMKEESQELRDHLEWLNYKESARKNSESSTEMTAIYNLRTTLAQGSGFSAMTSIIDTLSQTAGSDPEGNIKIESDLFQLLIENNEHTKSMLRGLAHAVDILDQKFILEKISSTVLQDSLSEISHELGIIAKEKSITINLPIYKGEHPLSIDRTLFQTCVKELLLNAIKYAPEKTSIDVFVTITDGFYCLSVKNSILDDIYGNITEEVQKNLILPFYRLHPPVEKVHKLEPFSLGLGLTMVDFIANKHHGMFFIRKAKDHTSKELSICMIAELFFPIQV
jgi:DNA-binding response OmpR family regulator